MSHDHEPTQSTAATPECNNGIRGIVCQQIYALAAMLTLFGVTFITMTLLLFCIRFYKSKARKTATTIVCEFEDSMHTDQYDIIVCNEILVP